jgi:2-phosphoglycerate kinase
MVNQRLQDRRVIMADADVITIGGAPLSGKTTLAKRLAAQLGYALVAIDDLGTAVRAVTSPQSHPALHPMAGWDYHDYYLEHPPDTLIRHAAHEHETLWPAMASVIQAHLQWAGPIIMEGWQLDPVRVASLHAPQVRACWLLADEALLEARLRADEAFYQAAFDVERFIRHYLARSRWVNERLRRATAHASSVVIRVGLHDTVESLVNQCLKGLWPG